MDAWVERLKTAYGVGYYRTEPAVEAQTAFPWRNKTCKDCPFWANSVCQVFTESRNPMAHTCSYFNPLNREAAQHMIQERQEQGFRRWWEWFNDRGAP